jgi:hypothetical protein
MFFDALLVMTPAALLVVLGPFDGQLVLCYTNLHTYALKCTLSGATPPRNEQGKKKPERQKC